MMEAEAKRMRWRCRRGMLELDIVLERFVMQHYPALKPEGLKCFDILLDYPDGELWELIVGKKHSDQPDARKLLAMLRNCAAGAVDLTVEIV